MHEHETLGRHRWIGRPWVARLVRVLVYLVPFAASILAAFVLSAMIPPAATWPIAIVRLIVIAICSTIVLFGVDKLTRKALPLAALLDLTLVFPDEAPSRFRVALRSGGTRTLEQRLAEYRSVGQDEPAQAAEHLLELVAELGRHDRRTRGHSERVRAYAHMIGEELGLKEDEVDKLQWAALLHDIGKLEIPPEILNKPEHLNPNEYDITQPHTEIGVALTAPLAGWLGDWVGAVGEHHERWDGAGYPNGISGTGISYAARIVSVADTFDVMTSVRSYRPAGSAAFARQELADCAGTQFDPAVVRAFLSISLGKLRMAMGPLSWLTQLALFPPGIVSAGAAPAMTAVAGFTAAAVGIGIAPSEFVEAGEPDDVAITESIAPISTTLARGTAAPSNPGAATVAAATPTTTTPPATTTTSFGIITTTPPATTLPGSPIVWVTTPPGATASDPTVPKIASPALPTPTVPRVGSRTTTTLAPAATATTTTTTATTTTTTPSTVPSAMTYLLGSSGVGDVTSQPILPLVDRNPLNETLPNLGTDRDDNPGLRIHKGGIFEATKHEDRLQRFRLDPSNQLTLDGQVTASIWIAPKDFGVDGVQAAVALMDCSDLLEGCTLIANSTIDFIGVKDQFEQYTFDLGEVNRDIPTSNNLQLWVISTLDSQHDMTLAFDTVDFESSLTLNG